MSDHVVTSTAIGYRVRSFRGLQFRQWATVCLKEYLVKDFTLDDERLKGNIGVVDYFDELLERIQAICASEAYVYQRIRDIFSLAEDYNLFRRLFFPLKNFKVFDKLFDMVSR